jgi:arylsulfatase A-like enzyme
MFDLFKKKKLNVIMIMIDGVRHDVIDKNPFYKGLKKNSVFFPNLITYAPYTIGSLYSTFSGIYGNLNGVNGYFKSYNFDKKNCFTLTQYFKEDGYYTEADMINGDIAPQQGFDKVRVHDEFKDDLVIRHSEILRQIRSKQPFFLFLDYSKLHTNLVKEVIKKYSDFDEEYFKNKDKNYERYLGWFEKSGDYLKSILDKIKELGLYDNSIILIFTDHGVSVGDKVGEKAYGVYLHEYTLKCFLYLIGKDFPKGLEISEVVRSIDILPTIMEIFKLKEKTGFKKIQGASFLPFVSGNREARVAYSETGGLGGPNPSPEQHNIQCIRTNKWKLIYNKASKKKELYDLENDSKERDNLAGKYPDVESKLWEKIMEFSK